MLREKDIYSPYQIEDIKKWKEYLESNTELLKSKFRKIIEQYQFENLKNLEGREKEVNEIELCHGSGSLEFGFFAKTEDYEFNTVIEDGYLFPEYDLRHNNNFLYPPEMDFYYEDFRQQKCEKEKRELLFTWIAKNWMDCGGHKIGIVSGTWENNAAKTFSLNLFDWDSCINLPKPTSDKKIKYPLNRELTPFEIRQRTRETLRTPFITNWRYFEKGNKFFEIGLYAKMFSTRQGLTSEFATKKFNSSKKFLSQNYATKEIAQICNDLVNDGFFEKERPSHLPKIDTELIEWDYGLPPRNHEPITKEEFDEFETKNNIFLPSSYKWFIARMNNVKTQWQLSNFRIAFEKWKTFKEFYNFKTLTNRLIDFHSMHSSNKNLLPIAEDTEDGILLLDHKLDKVFYYSETTNLLNLESNFEAFIGNCTGINDSFYPIRYHINRGNTIAVKDWFEKGGKLSDKKILGNRNILQDTTHNLEMCEVLLKNGANPNEIYINEHFISYECLDLLIKYGLDIEKKFEKQNLLKEYLRKRGGFENLIN